MEKIIELAEQLLHQAKVQHVAVGVKDQLIAEQKLRIAELESLISQSKAILPQVWITGAVLSGNLVKWTLNLSHALETELQVNIQHTDTNTGVMLPFKWVIPKGQTAVSGNYNYLQAKAASYTVEAGEGYEVSAIVDKPRSITVQLQTVTEAKAGIEYKGPLVITKGGVYTGNIQSIDSEIPAIEVKTSEAVIIESSNIRGAGYLIKNWYNNSDITIRNTNGYGLSPTAYKEYKKPRRFLILNDVRNLLIENCNLEGTAGIFVGGTFKGNGTSEAILIQNNRVKNIDGRVLNGFEHSQFLQFNCRGSLAAIIRYNEIVNEYGHCHVEDNINIYNTMGSKDNPIRIYGNLIKGAFYAPGITKSYTGGGIITDSPSSATPSAFIEVYDNYLIGLGNYSLGIAAGNNLKYINNYCVNAGVTDSGKTFTELGIYASGIWAKDYYNNGNTHTNVFEGNTVGVKHHSGRNDVTSSTGAAFLNTKHLPDPITKTTEDLYVANWKTMMQAKGLRS